MFSHAGTLQNVHKIKLIGVNISLWALSLLSLEELEGKIKQETDMGDPAWY